MSDVDIKVIGAKEIQRKFRRAARNVKSDTSKNLLKAAALIQRTARKSFKPGGGRGKNPSTGPFTLRKGTQQLSKSILVTKTGSGIGTIVKVGPKVKYGGIHEFGGTITPKRKKFLRFQVEGKVIFTKKVTIPARPYMAPSLEKNREAITTLSGLAFKPILP